MEAITYHLISSFGLDVIIIPELDCRISVFDLTSTPIPNQSYDQVLYATICECPYAFAVVHYADVDLSPLDAAVRWYGYHVIYRNLDLDKQGAPPITITYSANK